MLPILWSILVVNCRGRTGTKWYSCTQSFYPRALYTSVLFTLSYSTRINVMHVIMIIMRIFCLKLAWFTTQHILLQIKRFSFLNAQVHLHYSWIIKPILPFWWLAFFTSHFEVDPKFVYKSWLSLSGQVMLSVSRYPSFLFLISTKTDPFLYCINIQSFFALSYMYIHKGHSSKVWVHYCVLIILHLSCN